MKIRQWKSKLPLVIIWLAIGSVLVLMGVFAPDSTGDDKAIFLGAWAIAFAILFFFWGSIDWSQWNSIKARLAGKPESPTEVEVPIESESQGSITPEELPTTFGGWYSALVAACALIWVVVGFVVGLCHALLD
jgi:hypothetical protein